MDGLVETSPSNTENRQLQTLRFFPFCLELTFKDGEKVVPLATKNSIEEARILKTVAVRLVQPPLHSFDPLSKVHFLEKELNGIYRYCLTDRHRLLSNNGRIRVTFVEVVHVESLCIVFAS